MTKTLQMRWFLPALLLLLLSAPATILKAQTVESTVKSGTKYLFNDQVELRLESNDGGKLLATLPLGQSVEILDVTEDRHQDGLFLEPWYRVKTRVDGKIWEGWLKGENLADQEIVEDWDGDGVWEMLLVRNRTYSPFADYNLPWGESKLEFRLAHKGEIISEMNLNVLDAQEVLVEWQPKISGFEPELNIVNLNFSRATDPDKRVEDTYFYTFDGTELTEVFHAYSILEPKYSMVQTLTYPGEQGVKKNEIVVEVEITREGAYIDEEMDSKDHFLWNGKTFKKQK